jgi:hypothetical protein
LTNAPAVFQRFVNSLFQDKIDIYVVLYLDDILIFSSTIEEHIQHVKEVMKRLRDNNLVLKLEKCEKEVIFFGFVISDIGIKMKKEKTQAISRIEAPKTVKQVRSFFGMINFYRKFIHNLSNPSNEINQEECTFCMEFRLRKGLRDLEIKSLRRCGLKAPGCHKGIIYFY